MAGASREAPKATANLMRHFSHAAQSMQQEIATDIDGDVEMQVVVKAAIKEFKDNRISAEQAQMSVSELVKATTASRKRKADEESEEETEITQAVTGELRRGQLVYGNWTQKLLDEAMHYVDPRVMDKRTLKILSVASKKECLELGMDLLVHGSSLDRVGNKDKGALLAAMKEAYNMLGERWQHLEIDANTGEIQWESCGPWVVGNNTTHGTAVVTLKAWAIGGLEDKAVVINEGNLMGDSGPFDIVQPFSMKQAGLRSQSTREIYALAAFFPGVGRRLGKRPSDMHGVANRLKLSAAEAIEAEKDGKRRASKAAPLPIKTFKKAPPVLPAPAGEPGQPAFAAAGKGAAGSASVAETTPTAAGTTPEDEAKELAAMTPLAQPSLRTPDDSQRAGAEDEEDEEQPDSPAK